jgi:hypothetical protein
VSVELYLPNRKTLQDLYVPSEVELPEGDARCQVFNFAPVNPFEVQEVSWVADKPLVVWGLNGTMNNFTPPGAAVAAGFRVAIFQTHGKTKWAWMNKHQINANILGQQGLPFLLRSPQLVGKGDSLIVEIKSLVTAVQGNITRVQVAFFGVQPLFSMYPQLYADSGVTQ